MDLNQLKSAVALLEALQTPTPQSGTVGRKVIVRSRDAGVIYGEYAGNDGSTVHLRNAVQMWKWFAAKGISLIDVATFGVKKSDCKFSTATATVTVFNACALIDVTADAAASIEAV
jgi:methyl coenzyme M reductase beta subunit